MKVNNLYHIWVDKLRPICFHPTSQSPGTLCTMTYIKEEERYILIKPKKIKPGSRIAIISPSNGLPFLFPDIYELGLKNLKEIFGFEIVEMPTARMSPDELYKNPKLRADDINQAFSDDSIDGIITSIGGYESIRILKYLDIDIIKKNPNGN